MQKNTWLVLVLGIALASCGDSPKDVKVEITEKKVELEKLRKDQKSIASRIDSLEAEIARADPSAIASRARLVNVTPLTVQDFAHYIELQGKIEAENISYAAPRGGPGLVKAVYVKEGDFVRKGQLLLKLDDAVQLQGISALETQLQYARNIYQRQENLWKQGIGTEVQYITAKNNVDALQKQIATARETWRLTQVTAEVSGIADEVNIHPGETFTGNPMQGIKIVNTGSLKMVTDIPETYIARVRRGSTVQIVVPDLGRVINSSITRVSQSIDPNSRGFKAEASIKADAALKPNLIATMKILDYKAANVIVVPVNTVQTDEKGRYVYIMEKSGDKLVARKRQVHIGETYNGMVEIKAGLKDGDQLITEGYLNLYEGQVVTTTLKA